MKQPSTLHVHADNSKTGCARRGGKEASSSCPDKEREREIETQRDDDHDDDDFGDHDDDDDDGGVHGDDGVDAVDADGDHDDDEDDDRHHQNHHHNQWDIRPHLHFSHRCYWWLPSIMAIMSIRLPVIAIAIIIHHRRHHHHHPHSLSSSVRLTVIIAIILVFMIPRNCLPARLTLAQPFASRCLSKRRSAGPAKLVQCTLADQCDCQHPAGVIQ